MAWAIRRFPLFPIVGSGDYLVRPVYVDDLAALAVAAGSQAEDTVTDAVGPETLTFEALLHLLASAVGSRCRFIHTSPTVSLALTGLVGMLIRDVVLTRDEIDGLMAGLLTSDGPATGTTSLSAWLDENGEDAGPPVRVGAEAQLPAVGLTPAAWDRASRADAPPLWIPAFAGMTVVVVRVGPGGWRLLTS